MFKKTKLFWTGTSDCVCLLASIFSFFSSVSRYLEWTVWHNYFPVGADGGSSALWGKHVDFCWTPQSSKLCRSTRHRWQHQLLCRGPAAAPSNWVSDAIALFPSCCWLNVKGSWANAYSSVLYAAECAVRFTSQHPNSAVFQLLAKSKCQKWRRKNVLRHNPAASSRL